MPRKKVVDPLERVADLEAALVQDKQLLRPVTADALRQAVRDGQDLISRGNGEYPLKWAGQSYVKGTPVPNSVLDADGDNIRPEYFSLASRVDKSHQVKLQQSFLVNDVRPVKQRIMQEETNIGKHEAHLANLLVQVGDAETAVSDTKSRIVALKRELVELLDGKEVA